MLLTGLMIFMGVVLILAKLPRRLMLKALHHDVALDLTVSALTLIVHWGTFSGVMAATVAGLMTSLATSAAKRLFGSIHSGRYYPGVFYLDVNETSLRSTSPSAPPPQN
jgi:nucleoside permease NupC